MRKARRYAPAPIQRTALKPTTIASIMATMGARTERHPLVAQAQGIMSGVLVPRFLIPSGKGIPIRRQGRKRMTNTDAILRGIE